MAEVVECHSGSVYAEWPAAFEWEGRRLKVEVILQRWRGQDGKGFRVLAEDGRVFTLFYDEFNDAWSVELI